MNQDSQSWSTETRTLGGPAILGAASKAASLSRSNLLLWTSRVSPSPLVLAVAWMKAAVGLMYPALMQADFSAELPEAMTGPTG